MVNTLDTTAIICIASISCTSIIASVFIGKYYLERSRNLALELSLKMYTERDELQAAYIEKLEKKVNDPKSNEFPFINLFRGVGAIIKTKMEQENKAQEGEEKTVPSPVREKTEDEMIDDLIDEGLKKKSKNN